MYQRDEYDGGGCSSKLEPEVRSWRCRCSTRRFSSTRFHVHAQPQRAFFSLFLLYVVLDRRLRRRRRQVGTFNATGQRFVGHYDPHIYDELQALTLLASPSIPTLPLLKGWTNGSLYAPSTELFGILPISSSTREEFHLLEPSDSLPSTASPPSAEAASQESRASRRGPKRQRGNGRLRHAYLSKRQGTLVAVLVVSTSAERKLFASLNVDFAEEGKRK